MQIRGRTIVLFIAAATLAYIIVVARQSADTPTAPAIPSSTWTPIPQSQEPIATLPVLPIPSEAPLTAWNDIPVMPGALAGNMDSASYSFTIQSPLPEVQKFYETEMSARGWELFGSRQGATNAVLLIFSKDENALSVSILPQTDGLTYVLLTK
jgi:hypothetical protein